jgi:hypothetical protein
MNRWFWPWMLLIAGAGANVAAYLPRHTDFVVYSSRIPPELSDAERSAREIVLPVLPIEVRLRFVTDADWELITLSQGRSDVEASTFVFRNPCEVWFRAADWTIEANPAKGRAQFQANTERYPDDIALAFPHELLHCMRGGWHPEWSEILDRQAISSYTFYQRPERMRERMDGQ